MSEDYFIDTATMKLEDYENFKKEIERLKKENTTLKQTMSNNSLLINENVLLKSIIKEVRECINEKLNINSDYVDYDFGTELLRHELLQILDKVEENK